MDFFDFSLPDFDLGGGDLDTSWLDDYDYGDYGSADLYTPDFSMDFSEPAYSFGADLDMGGWDQYLPDFSLGGGGGGYSLFGDSPDSIVQPGGYSLWAGLDDEYNQAAEAGAGVEQYDPSTGAFFDRSGNVVQPQGGGPTSGGGTWGSILGGLAGAAGTAGKLVAGGGGGGGTQPTKPAAGGGILGTINSALDSPLGKMLATLGIGGASVGLGHLLAGDAPETPTLNLPPQSPTGQATEGALLDALGGGGRADLTRAAGQSIAGTADLSGLLRQMVNQEQATETAMQPGFADARMRALGLIPGQLDTSMDPVQAALQGELMQTIEGQANPIVEDQIRKDWAALQNQMFRRLGPDWELSSAGQEVKQAFDRSSEQRRFGSRMDTIRTLQPLQASQQQVTGGERRANLGALTGATALGRNDPYRVGTQLNTIAPVGAYLGADPDRFRSLQANLETQSALMPYQQATKEREDLMTGISKVGALGASSIGGVRL